MNAPIRPLLVMFLLLLSSGVPACARQVAVATPATKLIREPTVPMVEAPARAPESTAAREVARRGVDRKPPWHTVGQAAR